MVNIDYNRMVPGSYQMDDYCTVIDQCTTSYRYDDNGMSITRNGTTTFILHIWTL